MNGNSIENLKNKFIKSNNKYDAYFTRYFFYLMGLAISRFKWENLPNEIDPVFLERMLFDRGFGIFYKDSVTGLFAVMKGYTAGNLDIYGYGDMRFAYANQYVAELDKNNSVILHDNRTDYPTADIIAMHADALANMRLSRDVNLIANRTPVIVTSNSNMQLSVRNVMKQIIDCIPFINLKKGGINMEDLKALKTDAPVLFPELDNAMRWEIAECCKYLGINAFTSDKKERLVAGEVSGEIGEIEIARNNALLPRQRAVEQINRVFGLNIKVTFDSEIPLYVNENVSRETMESEVDD